MLKSCEAKLDLASTGGAVSPGGSAGWYGRWSGAIGRTLAKRQSDRQGAISVGLFMLFAKGLGFGREALMAYLFGTTAMVDAFALGTTVYLLLFGIPSYAFLTVGTPLLVEASRKQDAAGYRRLLGGFLGVGVLLAIGLSAAVLVGAPFVIRIVGLGVDAETLEMTNRAVRLMLPMGLAIVFVAVLSAHYNARRQFILPKLLEPIVSICAIAMLLILGRRGGILSLAGGWSVGHLVALGAIALPLIAAGLCRPAEWISGLRHPGVRQFGLLSMPLIFGYAAQQVNITVNRMFASMLEPGSIAALSYAQRLYFIPVTLVMTSIVTVYVTRSAEMAVDGRIDDLRKDAFRMIRRLTLMAVPLSFGFFFFGKDLVRLVFERGAFGPESTVLVGGALAWYGLGLVPYLGAQVMVAAFKGMKRTRVIVAASIVNIGVNIVLNALLVRRFGIAGLAGAVSAAYVVEFVILFVLLRRKQQ